MNRRYILGNWKMHHGPAETSRWCKQFLEKQDAFGDAVVGIFPPASSLAAAAAALGTSLDRVQLGAQTCHWESSGAYTGEVSAGWLHELRCRWVLVGHSERRTLFGETDPIVRRKLEAVLEAGLEPVLCVGETLEERERGQTEKVLDRQTMTALEGMEGAFEPKTGLLIAYEPVWAIGTGHSASPEQAAGAHRHLRERLSDLGGSVPILYGGSVKPSNVAELMAQDGIDGALVGGASLDPATFAELVENAAASGS